MARLFALLLLVMAFPSGVQGATAVKPFRDCPDCPEMVTVPVGIFMMGASNEEADRYQRNANLLERTAPTSLRRAQPQHSVVISQAFAIGRYPVTRGEFAAFVHQTGYDVDPHCLTRTRGRRARWVHTGARWNSPGFDQEDHDPVVCVTWADANAYIGWLNKKTGTGGGLYRLPSEAEYEYAARGGTTTHRWWGDDIGQNRAVCDGCRSPWDRGQPAPVGLYGANQYGVSDILGGVWEWTQDCWNRTYDQAPSDGSPWLAGDCGLRVARGGAWLSSPDAVRSDVRTRFEQDSSSYALGFRVVKSSQ